jgi:hypothetical protein
MGSKASKLAAVVDAIGTVHVHAQAAQQNLLLINRLPSNLLDLPKDPKVLCAALEATIDELQQAVRVMKATAWPTEEECAKL